ncbi:phytochrome-like protein cph2 (plasmid) [Cellulomonas sp. WB94]|uniref:sensor domain-containing phosphodiesterase n=1 Tax=Cellulomonas sp. WB94 TaxID=2173174 RepID=UPI000D56EB73|nr:EAL domain-containing protein [Cellulomonas sp. WB94]PVU81430.1 phytochrome-like protein cph2 [Cellulomonas sp. WB94]
MSGHGDASTAHGPSDDEAETAGDLAGHEFVGLLERRNVHVVFQPVLDLRSGETVALEALARGPLSSPFETPRALFDAARRCDRVAELDWVCRAAAYHAFLAADIPPAMSLFVNIEPEAFANECPPDLVHLVARAESVLRVFVEVNDRALTADPGGVLAAVDRARQTGWGIILDDVGASRARLAMLPIVHADLVKLDLRLLNEASAEDSAAVITSVLRHVERTGASLLVEGIESESDAQWARTLGASYGQGIYLGAPAPLDDQYLPPRAPVPLIQVAWADPRVGSPFELVADRVHERMDGEHLRQLAQVIAPPGRGLTGAWPVVLGCVGRDHELSQAMAERAMGRSQAPLCVIFGAGPLSEPAPGVRIVHVDPQDPLADERFLIILSDQAPIAVLARSSSDGFFDVTVTQDPELVHVIAHHLIRRVPGPGHGDSALRVPARERERFEQEDPAAPVAPSKRGWRRRS